MAEQTSVCSGRPRAGYFFIFSRPAPTILLPQYIIPRPSAQVKYQMLQIYYKYINILLQMYCKTINYVVALSHNPPRLVKYVYWIQAWPGIIRRWPAG